MKRFAGPALFLALAAAAAFAPVVDGGFLGVPQGQETAPPG